MTYKDDRIETLEEELHRLLEFIEFKEWLSLTEADLDLVVEEGYQVLEGPTINEVDDEDYS